MASALYRLGSTAYRKWPYFIVGWLIAIIGLGGLSQAINKPLVDSFSIPGGPLAEGAVDAAGAVPRHR